MPYISTLLPGVERCLVAQPVQQSLVQPFPDPGRLPITQPRPARPQDEQDAAERRWGGAGGRSRASATPSAAGVRRLARGRRRQGTGRSWPAIMPPLPVLKHGLTDLRGRSGCPGVTRARHNRHVRGRDRPPATGFATGSADSCRGDLCRRTRGVRLCARAVRGCSKTNETPPPNRAFLAPRGAHGRGSSGTKPWPSTGLANSAATQSM